MAMTGRDGVVERRTFGGARTRIINPTDATHMAVRNAPL
jgi:hypothetical protein